MIVAAGAFAGDAEYPPAALLVVIALSYCCGAHAPSGAGAAGMSAILVALELTAGISGDALVPAVFCTVGPWLTGRAVRSRRELVAALTERARELEAEQDAFTRLAVRHERARIARELHDIVAHNLAVMVVQAGAGRMAWPEPPERAAGRFGGIGEAGGQALSELTRLVDVLHEDDRDGDRHRRQLELMLDRARAAGLNISAATLPPGIELPRQLEDTAHRVVQEGVTNALKHAPGADVQVRLVVRDGVLEIEVRDGGARARPTLADTGAGLGLNGLRERVTAAGGRLDAAPAPALGLAPARAPPGRGLIPPQEHAEIATAGDDERQPHRLTRRMELIAAVMLAGPLGYFARTRRQASRATCSRGR